MAGLRAAFGEGVVVKQGCDEIGGYTVNRDRARRALTLRMTLHVDNAVARYEPGILEGKLPSAELPPQSRKGALERICEKLELPEDRSGKLTAAQTYVQEVAGAAKFFERLKPRLAWAIWRIMRVMSCPPPLATLAARLLLERAYAHRDEGITFGGANIESNPRLLVHMHGELDLEKPPPVESEAHADVTWNKDPDCYAVVITRFGGALVHGVWRFTSMTDSSAVQEAMGTCKAAEKLTVVQEMERGIGLPQHAPGVSTTDSSANWHVATRHASANKARHALRRWRNLRERLEAREAKLVHLPGVTMPADFLTKKSDLKKINASVNYVTNAANAVPATARAV